MTSKIAFATILLLLLAGCAATPPPTIQMGVPQTMTDVNGNKMSYVAVHVTGPKGEEGTFLCAHDPQGKPTMVQVPVNSILGQLIPSGVAAVSPTAAVIEMFMGK